MRVFDFNVHLPTVSDENVNKIIENDLSLSAKELCAGFEMNYPKFSHAKGANFLLFNTDLFSRSIESFKELAKEKLEYSSFTALIDFRRQDIIPYLEQVRDYNVKALMVNSYLQQISDADFNEVVEVCKFAESNEMIICIDGSYGTSKMYQYDNIKLACFVSDLISKVPIVIIHSGALRIKEAMLLALDKPNVWLDTSFSLPYYIGSSIEQDFAFAYKKIGTHRVVYGSDVPYLNSEKALQIHQDYFEKYGFSDEDIENIFFKNAINVLGL